MVINISPIFLIITYYNCVICVSYIKSFKVLSVIYVEKYYKLSITSTFNKFKLNTKRHSQLKFAIKAILLKLIGNLYDLIVIKFNFKQMLENVPRHGSFFTKNSSNATHPPPTRTMTVLRRMRTNLSFWLSPNWKKLM